MVSFVPFYLFMKNCLLDFIMKKSNVPLLDTVSKTFN